MIIFGDDYEQTQIIHQLNKSWICNDHVQMVTMFQLIKNGYDYTRYDDGGIMEPEWGMIYYFLFEEVGFILEILDELETMVFTGLHHLPEQMHIMFISILQVYFRVILMAVHMDYPLDVLKTKLIKFALSKKITTLPL